MENRKISNNNTPSLSSVGSSSKSDSENGHVEIESLEWYSPGEHRRVIFNVIFISLAFELLFTAFLGMSSLQSSIVPEGGLGVYAMSLTHVIVVISAIFLPTFVIHRLTAKYTMVFAMLGYTTFQAAQYYPTFWTLVPSSIIVGICAAPLWAAKCTYITHVGHLYADIMGIGAEGVVVRFFGIFFFSFQSSLIWGNLISSVVLSYGSTDSIIARSDNDNDTTIIQLANPNHGADMAVCGREFCPSYATQSDVISKPPTSQIHILAGIYLVLNVAAAVMIAIFVDPLSRFGEGCPGSAVKSTKATIAATIKQMGTLSQILLIPLTLWSGMNLGFYFADFSQAFVACALGVESIGYIGMAFGICDAVCSIGFGVLVRYLGRLPVFTFGAVLNIFIIIMLYNWNLDSTDRLFLFIISGLYGMGDAIWQTQINGLYGLLFKENSSAAFSNYRLWESMGFIIGFVNSNLLCVQIKLYILFGVLCTGMAGYYTVEYLERRKTKSISKL